MTLLNASEIMNVSGGEYNSTSVDMTFNIPLANVPAFTKAFPKLFTNNELTDFVAFAQSEGLDPKQISVEISVYKHSSVY